MIAYVCLFVCLYLRDNSKIVNILGWNVEGGYTTVEARTEYDDIAAAAVNDHPAITRVLGFTLCCVAFTEFTLASSVVKVRGPGGGLSPLLRFEPLQ